MIKKFLEKVKREAGEFFDGTVPGMEDDPEIRTFMEITENPPRIPYKVVNSRPQLSRDEILELEARQFDKWDIFDVCNLDNPFDWPYISYGPNSPDDD